MQVFSEPLPMGLLFVLILALFAWLMHVRLIRRDLDALQQLHQEQTAQHQQLEHDLQAQLTDLKAQLQQHQASLTRASIQEAQYQERLSQAEQRIRELMHELESRQQRLESIQRELADAKARTVEQATVLKKEREASAEKLALLEEARENLKREFQLLANQIFEEKGKAFSEQNRTSLDAVLRPVREQLNDFRKKVEEVHIRDAEGRASLVRHLEQLEQLNRQMSEDAMNLTQALKGESKAQGNWGEMILERILESSGLREGHEFVREDSTTLEGGKRLRPDVVVHMPGDKHIVIDSKVSLSDYERALSAADEEERKRHIKAHVASLKAHIRALAEKRYDQLPGLNSPDYVLMFVPIEGAYMMAIEADQGIFEDAFDRRVAVVTPSTLYATLKLIEQLWRYERQSENVVKLINRASKLHDKVVDFVKSFEEIGTRLEQARKAYDTAHGRIVSGPGNVIRQIDQLGRLAGRTQKELPRHLTEAAALGDDSKKPSGTGDNNDAS